MSVRGHTPLRHAQQPGWARGLSGGDYISPPRRMGLLTQINSTC
ncbi:hypothetical protein [Streptomyces sp. NPDC012466]|jgi:hypothetical protein